MTGKVMESPCNIIQEVEKENSTKKIVCGRKNKSYLCPTKPSDKSNPSQLTKSTRKCIPHPTAQSFLHAAELAGRS